MKKNIVLSSVAAVAVAGMLVLSGCGGNSGSTKKVENVVDSKAGKISVVAGQASDTLTVSFGGNKDRGQDNISVTVKEIRCGTTPTASACETKCTTQNPCEVKVETGCGVVDAKNALVNDTSAEAANKAFAELAKADKYDDDKPVVIEDTEFVGFDGVTVLTSDDVDSCTVKYSTFIKCALDRDGKKYYVAQSLDKDQKGAIAEYAIVQITTVKDGKETTTWKKVKLDYTAKVVNGKTLLGQPFVNLENLALNGNLPAKIKVFTILAKAGSKSHGGVSGVSGGTGAVGE
jgi:hypothetical protein